MTFARACCVGFLLWTLVLCSPALEAADWPRWCGHSDGNMICSETGLPDSFAAGRTDPKRGGINMATTKNVKWVARLGSNAYGNPTVADGRVYVGTDDLTLSEDSRFNRATVVPFGVTAVVLTPHRWPQIGRLSVLSALIPKKL